MDRPAIALAALPLIVVIAVNLLTSFWVLPRLEPDSQCRTSVKAAMGGFWTSRSHRLSGAANGCLRSKRKFQAVLSAYEPQEVGVGWIGDVDPMLSEDRTPLWAAVDLSCHALYTYLFLAALAR